jgi:RND family efflux transporter MFP subunit
MTRTRVVLILAAIGIAALIWWRSSDGEKKSTRDRPVFVETTLVRTGAAPLELAAMGQVLSPHSVGLRPQVTGALTQIFFTEGTDVKAGDKLFQIDPAPYKAAVAQARAQLARDRAAMESARSQFERLEPLAEKEYASVQEIDAARTAMMQAQAVVESDQAAVTQAQINLDRTLVTAPIAGRTGSMSVNVGNIVGPSDATPVVVINQLQPIQVDYAIPQSSLPAIQQALARGVVPVRVSVESAAQPVAEGKLVFVDNAVSPATGTVRLRAEVDNKNLALWPGAFVTVAMTLEVEENAVLVPELAVQPGAEGSFVFLVDPESKLVLRNVKTARQVGGDVVIAEGLKGGEKIVARAPRNLSPGMKVQEGAPKRQ